MMRCERCERPQGHDWQVCGWCGHEPTPKAKGRLRARLRGAALMLQAVSLLAMTVTLGVVWAMQGWTAERGQTLGIIWIGVLLALVFIAKSAANQGGAQRADGETPAPTH
ncbi:MAG: hypothetical protein VW450_06975 [Chloroflexota bacterium]